MKKLYVLIFLIGVFTACTKNTDEPVITDPKVGLLKISEGYAIGAATRVELWSTGKLSTGFNNLYLALYDSLSNQSLNKANLQMVPVMDMVMNGMHMTHAAPCIQPESIDSENTLFGFAPVFTMAGLDDNSWSIDVKVRKDGQTNTGTAKLAIAVSASSPDRVKSIITAAGVKLVVSYFLTAKPKVGVNDCWMTIHRQQDMMTFIPESSYLISMTPEMPAMGHGSPNNVNPVINKNGLYKGKVNFTMTGDWKINLELTKDGQKSTTAFDLSF